MNLKRVPYPLLERSEPPGDQVDRLAGDEAAQDGRGSEGGDRRSLVPLEAPQVPEAERHLWKMSVF